MGIELPVNICLVFEGIEESRSLGLDKFNADKHAKPAGSWFHGVDTVCISDNYWLNTRTPYVTYYGLRGLNYMFVEVSGPACDLHSGVFGRTGHEPMTDLIALLGKMVASDGRILVPGVDDMVNAADDEENALYDRLDYSIADIETAIGASTALSDDKTQVIMDRMRQPSLSIHRIECAFYSPGAKTVISAKVTGKFSTRLVPPKTPENVSPLVIQYLEGEFAKLNSKNKLCIYLERSGKPWVADIKHWNYEAAIGATQAVYNKLPDMTHEGGSVPVTLTFTETLGVNVLLLPMGRGDNDTHLTNKKLDRSNFIEGTKLLGTYLHEIATIKA